MLKIGFILVFLLALKCVTIKSMPILNKDESSLNTCLNSNSCDKNNNNNNNEEIIHFKKKIASPELCQACDDLIPFARYLIDANKTEIFKPIAIAICVGLKLTQESICSQAIQLFEFSVLTVIRDTKLSNKDICSAALGCSPITNPLWDWNITLPNVPKPPYRPPKLPASGSPTVRILHISDLHIDFEYQPGSLAECGQPLCCRNSSSSLKTSNNNSLAGYWGDYRNCDLPLWTLENMFEQISQNEKFDFVYWTGDLPPHNVWNQSRQDQISALDKLTELFLKYFPNKVIYPGIGNHEATPCNLFPPPFVKEDNISWLYTVLADDWVKTGLPSYLASNITFGAFYTAKLYDGLRLVSLNMNYCANENFWLLINATDPLDQLKWLSVLLQNSENIGEKVHIIGHIHPSGCLYSWSSNYYRIINRYESTITGQFFGHTHKDEFEIFYDLDNLDRAVNMAYLGGSATTYSFLNPNYRIYTVDGNYSNSSWQVLDHETYIMNLTDANLNSKPTWKKEYSVKDAFNMTSLFPEDWSNLINKLLTDLNNPLIDKLYKYYYKSSNAGPPCETQACKKSFLCMFKQARSDNFIPC